MNIMNFFLICTRTPLTPFLDMHLLTEPQQKDKEQQTALSHKAVCENVLTAHVHSLSRIHLMRCN